MLIIEMHDMNVFIVLYCIVYKPVSSESEARLIRVIIIRVIRVRKCVYFCHRFLEVGLCQNCPILWS